MNETLETQFSLEFCKTQELEIDPNNIYIYMGDCLQKLKELPEGKYCIVTDPPFNVNYHYKNYKDKLPEKEYLEMLQKVCNSLNSPYVLVHYPEMICKIAMQNSTAPEKVVSWVYNSNTAKQHRDVAFFKVKPDFTKAHQPYKNLKDKRIQKRIAEGSKGARLYDWWNVNQVKNVQKANIDHPCVMPLEVMENIIKIIPDDYVIVDPFMGSGTTGVAAKKLGRGFIGIEIDPIYYKIAEERIRAE